MSEILGDCRAAIRSPMEEVRPGVRGSACALARACKGGWGGRGEVEQKKGVEVSLRSGGGEEGGR